MSAGRTPVSVAWVLAVGVLGLAGCSTSPPPSSPSVSVSGSPTGSPSPVPVTGAGQKLVTLRVSGGVAGIDRQVVLRGDGTVRSTDKGESEVRKTGAAAFKELRTLLGDPALDQVPDTTVNTGAADLFQYTLVFDGRTVVTDRSSEQPALDRLIDALSAWLPQP